MTIKRLSISFLTVCCLSLIIHYGCFKQMETINIPKAGQVYKAAYLSPLSYLSYLLRFRTYRYIMGSSILFEPGGRFTYQTCSTISKGYWSQHENYIFLSSDQSRWRNDSLHTYGFQGRCTPSIGKPIKFYIHGDEIIRVLETIRGRRLERLNLQTFDEQISAG